MKGVLVVVLATLVLAIQATVPSFVGSRHHNCVYQVDEYDFKAEQVETGILVTTSTKKFIVPPCEKLAPGNSSNNGSYGYVASVLYVTKAEITNLYGKWIVPDAPPTYTNQTLFYWNGVEPYPLPLEVLQPVLQYGVSKAGGGAYWGIASWYAGFYGEIVVVSKLAVVKPGDVIEGTNLWNSDGSWQITAAVAGTNTSTSITYKPVFKKYYIATYALEVYDVFDCKNQYPAGVLNFTDIKLEVEGQPVVPNWVVSPSTSNSCGEHPVVISPTEVQIYTS